MCRKRQSPPRPKRRLDCLTGTKCRDEAVNATHQDKENASLVALCFLCYFPSLAGDFVFDDREAIVNNPVVRRADLIGLWSADFWGHPIRAASSHKSYRPVTTFTFVVEHWLFGLNPVPFHATNIVLHAVASVLCHRFLRTIARTLTYSTSCQQCYLAAVLFAVHPVHAEAVCNLVGRAELLMSIFALGAFLFYAKHGECNWSRIRLHASFFLCVVLALLSKEQGIMILPICATFDMLAAWQGNVPKKTCALRVALLVTLFIMLSLLRHWINGFAQPTFSAVDNPAAFHPSRVIRAINYVYVWLLNAWILVNPSQLCFDYSMGCIPLIEQPLLDHRFGVCLAVPPAVVCGLVWYYRSMNSQKTMILFYLAFGLLTFLPSSNLFATVGFVIAERVLYLPSAAFCALAASLYSTLSSRFFPKGSGTLQLLVVGLLAGRCIERSREWSDELTLYSSGLKVCPNNAKIHYNVAKILADRGELDVAEAEYFRAISLNPSYEQALNNLALILETKGHFGTAELLLSQSVTARPEFATAWMNLGIVQMSSGKLQEAEESFHRALAVRPTYADCLFNLGNLYMRSNRSTEARASWIRATSIDRFHHAAWLNLFILSEETDDCKFVFKHGAIALAHHPESGELHTQLGLCHTRAGNLEDAERYFLEAVRIDEKNAGFWSNLGTIHHRQAKLSEARNCYERALSLDASNSVAKENLIKLKRAV